MGSKRRCIEFWIKVLRMKESRWIKWVLEEVMQMEKKSSWQKDLEKC